MFRHCWRICGLPLLPTTATTLTIVLCCVLCCWEPLLLLLRWRPTRFLCIGLLVGCGYGTLPTRSFLSSLLTLPTTTDQPFLPLWRVSSRSYKICWIPRCLLLLWRVNNTKTTLLLLLLTTATTTRRRVLGGGGRGVLVVVVVAASGSGMSFVIGKTHGAVRTMGIDALPCWPPSMPKRTALGPTVIGCVQQGT